MQNPPVAIYKGTDLRQSDKRLQDEKARKQEEELVKGELSGGDGGGCAPGAPITAF